MCTNISKFLLLNIVLIKFAWAALPVLPSGQTAAVFGRGDVADDLAIWVDEEDSNRSTIIGMSKARKGGIEVFDLNGQELQFLQMGRIGGVDLRPYFPLDGKEVSLLAAINRSNNCLLFFRVDPASRMLEEVTAQSIRAGMRVYGCCLYHSQVNDQFYFIVTSQSGWVDQWHIFDNGSGRVDAERVRSFDVGGTTEGCVADDELGWLYIAEENKGIWKYYAEPDAGLIRQKVDKTGKGGHLDADVEGLALYYGNGEEGYLLASSQGNDSFAIYQRQGCNDYLGSFQITANEVLGIDGCQATDGIDVTSRSLGPAYPGGLFVAHDSRNTGGSSSNYKLVPWQAIAAAIETMESPSHLTVARAIIKTDNMAGTQADSLTLSGYLFHLTEDDFIETNSIEVRVSLPNDFTAIFQGSIPIMQGKLSGSMFSYKSRKGEISKLKIDRNKNTFFIHLKNIDLAGLQKPFLFEIRIGNYQGIYLYPPASPGLS